MRHQSVVFVIGSEPVHPRVLKLVWTRSDHGTTILSPAGGLTCMWDNLCELKTQLFNSLEVLHTVHYWGVSVV